MTGERRTYNEYCGLAKALDVVGERWTLLVVRNLLLGPLRYSELLRGLPGITTNLLAKRLQTMEEAGIIERVRTSDTGGSHAYRLTSLGQGLEPALHALARWGWRWMGKPGRGEHRSIEWLLASMRWRYRGGASLRAEVVADGVPYGVVLTRTRAEITRGTLVAPEVRVRGKAPAVAQFLLGGGVPRASGVAIEGDAAQLPELAGAFDWKS